MKIRFAAVIGMIIMISSSLPVQAASGRVSYAAENSGTAAVRMELSAGPESLRYLGNGWHHMNGSWYYVRSGRAVTGWIKDGGKWYFLGSDGRMKTGWIKDNGKWYYLNASGAMKTGWVKDRGRWYYLGANGAMKRGWLRIGDKVYYLMSGGARRTGWLTLKGRKYYFDANGVLNEEKSREANAPAGNSPSKADGGSAQTAAQNTAGSSASKKPDPEKSSSKAAAAKTKGDLVAEYALKFVGNPYVYGGCSLTEGTDCSGFVMLIYRHFGVSLPHYDAAIRGMGKAVSSLSEAKAGDIICYYGHVAIYLGDGRIVHASNSRDGIKISERADYRAIVGIRRIFD